MNQNASGYEFFSPSHSCGQLGLIERMRQAGTWNPGTQTTWDRWMGENDTIREARQTQRSLREAWGENLSLREGSGGRVGLRLKGDALW